jgi:hypothetical protein
MVWGEALWADQGSQGAPVYNPTTRTYFQLFDDGHSSTWAGARKRAAMKSFKGVRGRLAVIDSIETHNFVLKKLGLMQHDSSVWIGLRYWCSAHVLQWEGELPYSPSDAGRFRLWHNPWARASTGQGGAAGIESTCGMTASREQGFAPVYYRNIGGVVRWQATGAGKGFDSYLVEFVTNGE